MPQLRKYLRRLIKTFSDRLFPGKRRGEDYFYELGKGRKFPDRGFGIFCRIFITEIHPFVGAGRGSQPDPYMQVRRPPAVVLVVINVSYDIAFIYLHALSPRKRLARSVFRLISVRIISFMSLDR